MQGIISIAVATFLGLFLGSLIHRVEHGHVAVYYRGGYLLNEVRGPGFHVRVPLLTKPVLLPTKAKTEIINHVECTSSDGIRIVFDKVQVMYSFTYSEILDNLRNIAGTNPIESLIRLPTRRALQKFCEPRDIHSLYIEDIVKLPSFVKHKIMTSNTIEGTSKSIVTISSIFANPTAPPTTHQESKQDEVYETDKGLKNEHDKTYFSEGTTTKTTLVNVMEIHLVRPRVPEIIKNYYESLRAVKRQIAIAEEHQRLLIIEAETKAKVAKITKEMQENEKQMQAKIAEIQDYIDLRREKSRSDGESYKKYAQAEANKILLTEEYLKSLELLGNIPSSIPIDVLDMPKRSKLEELRNQMAETGRQ